MINLFLGVALVAAPFFFMLAPQTAHTLSQEYFFILVTMLGVLFFGIKETHRYFKVIALCLFTLALTTLNPYGLFQYYQLCLSITGAAFMVLVYSHRKEINYKFIGKCLSAVCVLESIYLLFQYKGIDLHGLNGLD
jgi:peptidoglycan/LPS O-acetylase OafA/YrhL